MPSPALAIGTALACLSALLYGGFAAYWALAAIASDTVVADGSVSLHGWVGVILATGAALGCGVALVALWGGRRLWVVSRPLALLVLAVGAGIGLWPAWALLTVPASA